MSMQYYLSESTTDHINYFQTLPNEVVLHILSFLDGITLLKVIPCLSVRFYCLANDDTTLWRTICQQHILFDKWGLAWNTDHIKYYLDYIQKNKSWKWLWMSKKLKYKDGMTGPASKIDAYNYICYEGDWIDGRRCGFGVSFLQDKFVYIGQWNNDWKHGFGKQIWSDGSFYEGQWVEGRKNGYGKYSWGNGEQYEGNWKNDEEHGYGVYRWSAGDIYSGEWYMGSKHGYGCHVWGEGPWKGDYYKGLWENDKQCGLGEYIWNDGRTYIGNWEQHQRHGYGVYTFPDGTSYNGEWIYGIRHGNAEYTTASGVKYNGLWNNDQMVDMNIPNDKWDRFFLKNKVEQRSYVKRILNNK